MTNKSTDNSGDVRLSGISKTYGSFTAVQPLDLTVPQGSFFALLGASGCGKTTTLRMIAGLEEPTSGTVHLGDQEVTRLPPYKRPVNTVFQSYALFPHLDIFENVAFGLRRRGIKSVKKQVEDMLELVQLGEQARKKPHQLSGGQQQRVAVARALINHPQGAPPRRAARRPRPQAAPPDAAGAQAHPDRGRHHLRARHARPGGGHDHGRHGRRDERGPRRTARLADRPLREPAHHLRRQLPRHLQPHRGRGRLQERRRDRAQGGRRQARPARGALLRARPRPAARCSSASARRRSPSPTPTTRARSPRAATASPARSPTPASSASPRSTSSTARSAPSSRSTPRTSTATPGWCPAPRSSCTGTRPTPSASTPPRTSTPGVEEEAAA